MTEILANKVCKFKNQNIDWNPIDWHYNIILKLEAA